jgi:hypothetical protein
MTKTDKIDRLMFWFSDGQDDLYNYTVKFAPLAMLLNRLINYEYSGKKIKFLNINFKTPRTFGLFDKIEPNYTHSYGGHVQHNTIFYRVDFESKSIIEQKRYVWDLAQRVLILISKDTKNPELERCCKLAYNHGLESDLFEDFIILENVSDIANEKIKAELWAEFDNDRVSARFKIFKNNVLVLNRVIDSTKSDTEFFYDMYKKIIIESNGQIILKGHSEIEYLPLKIDLNKI